jgi:hypothetical protein
MGHDRIALWQFGEFAFTLEQNAFFLFEWFEPIQILRKKFASY